jgi:peptidoglycan/xylan/chitin deacetylase (PgdA/CDA1 family)
VLTYHRVSDLSPDPHLLAVGIGRFEQQMRLLSKSYRTMTAGELFGLMVERRRIPDRTVVITFDDGYADVLHNAAPILAEHDLSATIFVSSDYVDSSQEFWWDELERIVLLAPSLPPRVRITAGGATFDAGPAAGHGEPDPAPRDSEPWDVTRPPATERQRMYAGLRKLILGLSAADRDGALESLRAQFGAERFVRPTHRPLSSSELRDLSAGGRVEIGAHTRSHQVLSARSETAQREEIAGGKRALEQACGHEVRSFSYPYGGSGTFSERTRHIVGEAGFLGACTTEFGIVVPWMDRFRVPRCPTGNIGGEEFVRRVEGWFRMAR